ncbi:molecular chaperone [Entomohabitans teleogrylli]|uniref:fimbrial biogenesis chaperone n=1 Tax=Entomohabitans teleogrylli TaxID=1384589 RepID=UPI0008FCA07C|nr:molecular chaperone [Entomohabitans teleogrylli]
MKKTGRVTKIFLTGVILSIATCNAALAALTIDRTRLVYDEGTKSLSLNITNHDAAAPYLAQGWVEDEQAQKAAEKFVTIPPLQRIDAGGKSIVRIEAMPDTASLPKDRESVFWFNLREIPRKNQQGNVLVLALQTSIKVFWRPKNLAVDPSAQVLPGADKLTLEMKGNSIRVNNPTPYYYSFVDIRRSEKQKGVPGFEATMAAPFSSIDLPVNPAAVGQTPALIYVNDYGSMKVLSFKCSGATCRSDGKNSK